MDASVQDKSGGNLARSYEQVVRDFGEWTAMCIHLGDGRYTRMPPTPDSRLRRFVQIAMDLCRKPMHELRVLDLGCLEGHYTIEYAMQGAEAVGVEIREANLRKAQFAQERLGLTRIAFRKDDVRNLSLEKYGAFDLVICAGILYHLDAPDGFEFMERVCEVCRGVAIIDTFVSLSSRCSVNWKGRTYWGLEYREHDPEASPEEKIRDCWASIDNAKSFWLNQASLCNLLSDVGFTSAYECLTPVIPGQYQDRRTYVAVRGQRARVLSSPPTDYPPRGEVLRTRRPPQARSSAEAGVAVVLLQEDLAPTGQEYDQTGIACRWIAGPGPHAGLASQAGAPAGAGGAMSDKALSGNDVVCASGHFDCAARETAD